MALVDFSNAHIEIIDEKEVSRGLYFFFLNGAVRQYNLLTKETTPVTSLETKKVIDKTIDGFKLIKTGTFSSAGNALVIVNTDSINTSSKNVWLITNIEYEAGDTFSFQITVNLNYN